MIKILEIGVDGFEREDSDRRKLHKERRIQYSRYLGSYDLILYSSQYDDLFTVEKESNNLTVYCIGGNKFLAFFRIFKLGYKIMKCKKIQVISSIDPFTCGFIALLLKTIFNVPLNIQLHFDYFGNNLWIKRSKFKKSFNIFLAKIVLKKCSSIRVVSSLQKEELRALGITKIPIEIIPTPVEIKSIDYGSFNAEVCARYRISTNTKLLLFVGRLEYEKDLPTLLKAFKLIKDNYKDVNLLIIGLGSLEIALKQMAIDLSINKNVHFLGSISHELIFSYYLGSDIFVISSVSEGRPTVLTEAALCKKPIIATRFSGTNDLILDGETGYIVETGDYNLFANKVLELLHEPEKLKKFGNRSYEYVKKQIEHINDFQCLIDLWQRTAELK